jgi:hypothetical protein
MFFTHKTYKNVFVSDDLSGIEGDEVINELEIQNVGLDLAKFFFSIILLEHLILGVKLLMRYNLN